MTTAAHVGIRPPPEHYLTLSLEKVVEQALVMSTALAKANGRIAELEADLALLGPVCVKLAKPGDPMSVTRPTVELKRFRESMTDDELLAIVLERNAKSGRLVLSNPVWINGLRYDPAVYTLLHMGPAPEIEST